MTRDKRAFTVWLWFATVRAGTTILRITGTLEKRIALMTFAKSFGIILVAGLMAGAVGLQAADKKEKAKAYPLDKCVVTDEKFEGSEMKPYEFVHEGQTIK